MAKQSYSAEDITVLEGLEPVRKRPGMYIGGVGSSGLHHLLWEILDNAVDEAMAGHATEIEVILHADGRSVTVTDNGRGIPVDLHPKYKKSALELVFCTLHAGAKFEDKAYRTAGGLHGVGASVTNALSARLVATVRREGAEWQMEFAAGRPVGPLRRLRAVRGSGTRVFFHPDPTIFPKTDFSPALIRERLEVTSYLQPGLKITYLEEATGEKLIFCHQEGLSEYLGKVLQERGARPVHEQPFVLSRNHEARIELALAWTEAKEEHLRSYVNGIPTSAGGTHENGVRSGVVKAVRNYLETHHLIPRGLAIGAEDIREGLVGILSVFVKDPQFQGQTKERLNNPELQSLLDAAVRPALEQWLNSNRTPAEQIVARIVLAARAREASRAASASVSRKAALSSHLGLPGKLSDCISSNRSETELFVVEGESAGGSAKQGRDRNTQAILPLRGKVLNTEGVSLGKVLENRELSDLVTALGCGIGTSFDPQRLRYHRIILLSDADSDGHHITTLLLTFFYRHLPELIRLGHLFVAVPPLYRIDVGQRTYWAADELDRQRILKQLSPGSPQPEITRFKGLGEMPPQVLWETTLNPATRRLLRVQIADALETDRVISNLMGKDPAPRFHFIMERAEEADELDL